MRADVEVLIVDDDEEIRTLLSELLADEGYRVREAIHGRDAMAKLEEAGNTLPSLILLDLMMPVMNGLELLDALATSEELRQIPVIVTTAAPDKAVGRSFASIVKKPYEVTALLAEIRRHEAVADVG
jgi:CheY-like chemotaxis protein